MSAASVLRADCAPFDERLGVIYADLRSPERAVAAFRKASSLYSDPYAANLVLGNHALRDRIATQSGFPQSVK
jgi:hypothetical protein